jgi:hypothetical protein
MQNSGILNRPRLEVTTTWSALTQVFTISAREMDLRTAFQSDPLRPETFTLRAPHMLAGLSTDLVGADTMRLLPDRWAAPRHNTLRCKGRRREIQGSTVGHIAIGN